MACSKTFRRFIVRAPVWAGGQGAAEHRPAPPPRLSSRSDPCRPYPVPQRELDRLVHPTRPRRQGRLHRLGPSGSPGRPLASGPAPGSGGRSLSLVRLVRPARAPPPGWRRPAPGTRHPSGSPGRPGTSSSIALSDAQGSDQGCPHPALDTAPLFLMIVPPGRRVGVKGATLPWPAISTGSRRRLIRLALRGLDLTFFVACVGVVPGDCFA
jgi:hypothetical protein